MAPNADQASEEAPGHYRHCQLEMLIKDLLDFNQRLVSCERMNFGSVIDFYDHIIANQKTWISIDILDQHPEEANYADFWEAERENGSFPREPSEELRLPMTQSYEDNQMMMMRFQEEIIADRERHNQE
jgi:hypothetical protein